MTGTLSRVLTIAWVIGFNAACGGGGSGTTNPPASTQRLNSVELTPSTLALSAGRTGLLTPVAKDQQGAVIDVASGYSFVSSVATVAEVSSTGSVLAVSAGSSTITVTLTRDGVTRSASAVVTVTGVLPDRGAVSATPDNAFVPDSIVISRGGQVTFTFQATHNVNFLGTGAPSNILTTSGATVERLFAVVGDFPFTCSLHGGMTGIVKVR